MLVYVAMPGRPVNLVHFPTQYLKKGLDRKDENSQYASTIRNYGRTDQVAVLRIYKSARNKLRAHLLLPQEITPKGHAD